MKGNGGNGGGGKPRNVIREGLPGKTPEEAQANLLENRKGQYLFLKLVNILGIKPTKKQPLGWITIGLDNIQYDLSEVLEKAIERILKEKNER